MDFGSGSCRCGSPRFEVFPGTRRDLGVLIGLFRRQRRRWNGRREDIDVLRRFLWFNIYLLLCLLDGRWKSGQSGQRIRSESLDLRSRDTHIKILQRVDRSILLG